MNGPSFLLLAALAVACSDDPGAPSDPAEVPSGPCSQQEAPRVLIGTEVSGDFDELDPGDPLRAVFGSQLGLEVEVLLDTSGFATGPEALVTVEVTLEADGHPVGGFRGIHQQLRCATDGSGGRLYVVFLLDVAEHPGVVTATELDGREARLSVTLTDGDDRSASADVPVVVQL